MTAVSVPGRADIEMLSRSVLFPSMVQVTPCTSRPPTAMSAAVWVRRTSVPSRKARSTLPMVTVSPSASIAVSTRAPLTKVPLMLRLSRISAVPEPSAAGMRVAWCREASTSGMTMSLSPARPILIAPAGTSTGRPGRKILSMLVAMLPSPDRGAAAGPITVADSSAGDEMGLAAGAGIGAGRDGCGLGGRGRGPVGDGYCPGCVGRPCAGGAGGGWLGRLTTGTAAVGGGEPANPW